jgi:putative flippase GtrA
VGGAAFVLDAGVVWALGYAGISPYWARVVSLCVSISFTFWLNRYLTFQANGSISWREVSAYIGASGIGILLNYAIYAGSLKIGLHWLVAMALGTIIASAFNFLAYGRIFKKR